MLKSEDEKIFVTEDFITHLCFVCHVDFGIDGVESTRNRRDVDLDLSMHSRTKEYLIIDIFLSRDGMVAGLPTPLIYIVCSAFSLESLDIQSDCVQLKEQAIDAVARVKMLAHQEPLDEVVDDL